MRLAILIYHYFPFGGQQRDFIRIAKEAVARGHEVTAFCIKWEGAVPDGLTVQPVPVTARSRHVLYQRFAQWVTGHVDHTSYDLILGFNKMPGLDMYFAADPCFAARMDQDRRPLIRFLPRYRHFLRFENAVFGEKADTQIMLLSPQQQQEFSEYYPGSAERLHLVPPGLGRDRFPAEDQAERRRQFRAAQQLHDNDIAIVQIGSGFRIKGVDRSIHSIAALPEALRKRCRLYVVGQGKSRKYQRLARRLGISQQVIFMGGRNDIPEILNGCDLMLHPAIQESAGYTILEGIINGLPVLTTDTCGYACHVQASRSGIVCKSPFSQRALNQALFDMLNSEKQQFWRENGLAYGKSANLTGLAEAAVNLIENTVTGMAGVTRVADVTRVSRVTRKSSPQEFDQ